MQGCILPPDGTFASLLSLSACKVHYLPACLRCLQGYLLKQSSNFRKEWKRRFFVLDSQGMLYYYSNKERSGREKRPQNTGLCLC